MDFQLNRVRLEERKVLYRLLQYLLYEESAHDGNEIGSDALFLYPWFDAYFTDPAREAYLFREPGSGKLLGFAMLYTVARNSASVHSIVEFMVLPPYRQQGVGEAAARTCFQMHTGTWEVSPSFGSESAYSFWERVIGRYIEETPRFKEGTFIFSVISR